MSVPHITIGQRRISVEDDPLVIAEIGINHGGSLEIAKKMARAAIDAGVDVVKHQTHIVDDEMSPEANKTKVGYIGKSIYELMAECALSEQEERELMNYVKDLGGIFLSTPFSRAAADRLAGFDVPAYKIGSGDITWTDIICKIAKKNKPVIISTGASNLNDVKRAVNIISKFNKKIVLMQCNTNYTADKKNLKYLNLNVLKKFKKFFGKKVILGLSDHTHGHTSVLGAVALGARVVEKHFTDDNNREGPDHLFSMNPSTWRKMVEETRNLESAFGDGNKKIEKNENQSSIVQRRCIRSKIKLSKGTILNENHLIYLRPCPNNALNPFEKYKILGKKLLKNLEKEEVINCQNTK